MRLLDSFAWIEYLRGSRRGTRVKTFVDGGEPLYTPSICLTEVRSRYVRDGKDPKERLNFIMERSFVVPLSSEIALLAADIKREHGLHTVDAIIYATSRQRSLTTVTGDQHFKDLSGVEMI